jgi:hypothetical protein
MNARTSAQPGKRLFVMAACHLLVMGGVAGGSKAHARVQWAAALKQRAGQGFARWARRHPGLASHLAWGGKKHRPLHRRSTRLAAAGLSMLVGVASLVPSVGLGQGPVPAGPASETRYGVVISSPRGSTASSPYGTYTAVVKGPRMHVRGPDDQVVFTLRQQEGAPTPGAGSATPDISISGSKVYVNGSPAYSIGGNAQLAGTNVKIDIGSNGEIRYLAPDGRVLGRLQSTGTPGSFQVFRGDQMVGTISLPNPLSAPTAR